jgi:hypothetical protein
LIIIDVLPMVKPHALISGSYWTVIAISHAFLPFVGNMAPQNTHWAIFTGHDNNITRKMDYIVYIK